MHDIKILIVASTRPEVIKLSPVMRELERRNVDYVFLTTGQHYDEYLFRKFIEELELREPDYNVSIGSGTHGYQTGRAILEIEKVLLKEKPDITVNQGDTNSTLSSAIASIKLHIPVAHVEAGLRSFDKKMPEEINRILTDHVSSLLFAPTEKSAINLINEGILPSKIFIVGNTIVDATLENIKIAEKKAKIKRKDHILVTLHRAENVDNKSRLKSILSAIHKISKENDVVFPIHPRTLKRIKEFNLEHYLKNIEVMNPLGYIDFIYLLKNAKIVLTDSGGVQEEAIVLKTPCVTLRTSTERPETVEAGGNIVAGVERDKILKTVFSILKDRELYLKMKTAKNPLGDGKSGKRIVDIILSRNAEIESYDLTKGFIERKFIFVKRKSKLYEYLSEKEIVLRVIKKGIVRFPFEDMELEEGDILEMIKLPQ